MDRYNMLVSRHLIAAVIEVGQTKGGVTLDTDAMVGWLTALPAKERSNLARVLWELHEVVGKANMRMLGREAGQVHDTIANRFGRVIQCLMCEAYTSATKQRCECCDRDIAPF